MQLALQTGYGSATRKSDTTNDNTYYYAVRLEDGNILRLSRTLTSMFDMFFNTIPITFAILLFVLFLALLLSSYLSKWVIEPVNRLGDELDALGKGKDLKVYDELVPFARKIRKLYKNNDEYITSIKKERDTINDIIDNMKEGLILLDSNKTILSLNESAKRMLGGEGYVDSPKNIIEVCRDPALYDAIECAMNEGNSSIDIERDKHFYRVFISKSSDSGVIIMLLDITDVLKAESIRRDFASNVSHELKTPITAIRGFAEFMSAGMIFQEADIKKYSGNIKREADRLIALIDDIIKLSKIEEDIGDKELERVDIIAEANNIKESLELLAKEKEVTIFVSGEHNEYILANKQQIYELLYNLIDNAVKYNKQGGRVDVSVAYDEENAIIKICDTGIGICPEHHKRIFERFYRVDKSRSRQTGGTGLGLSIVKHIVEKHNGNIQLKSNEGEGTQITVWLPKTNPTVN